MPHTGCRNSIHKRQAQLFTLFAPLLLPPDFGTRPVDRSAPPGHNKYIHLHGTTRYNVRKGPQPSGSRISDTIGSYLALPCSKLRCLSNRPCPPSLNLLRVSAEKRLAAHLHLLLSAGSTSFIGPVVIISLYALAETNTARVGSVT